jgi:hypothetical protein
MLCSNVPFHLLLLQIYVQFPDEKDLLLVECWFFFCHGNPGFNFTCSILVSHNYEGLFVSKERKLHKTNCIPLPKLLLLISKYATKWLPPFKANRKVLYVRKFQTVNRNYKLDQAQILNIYQGTDYKSARRFRFHKVNVTDNYVEAISVERAVTYIYKF